MSFPAPFAAPTLPTPLAAIRLVAPGAGSSGAAVVRLCRTGHDAGAPSDAPSGWLPSAGAVAALASPNHHARATALERIGREPETAHRLLVQAFDAAAVRSPELPSHSCYSYGSS